MTKYHQTIKTQTAKIDTIILESHNYGAYPSIPKRRPLFFPANLWLAYNQHTYWYSLENSQLTRKYGFPTWPGSLFLLAPFCITIMLIFKPLVSSDMLCVVQAFIIKYDFAAIHSVSVWGIKSCHCKWINIMKKI